jgi:hypothetical protein
VSVNGVVLFVRRAPTPVPRSTGSVTGLVVLAVALALFSSSCSSSDRTLETAPPSMVPDAASTSAPLPPRDPPPTPPTVPPPPVGEQFELARRVEVKLLERPIQITQPWGRVIDLSRGVATEVPTVFEPYTPLTPRTSNASGHYVILLPVGGRATVTLGPVPMSPPFPPAESKARFVLDSGVRYERTRAGVAGVYPDHGGRFAWIVWFGPAERRWYQVELIDLNNGRTVLFHDGADRSWASGVIPVEGGVLVNEANNVRLIRATGEARDLGPGAAFAAGTTKWIRGSCTDALRQRGCTLTLEDLNARSGPVTITKPDSGEWQQITSGYIAPQRGAGVLSTSVDGNRALLWLLREHPMTPPKETIQDRTLVLVDLVTGETRAIQRFGSSLPSLALSRDGNDVVVIHPFTDTKPDTLSVLSLTDGTMTDLSETIVKPGHYIAAATS